jgi:DnaJ family protein A protein 2
LPPKKVDVEPRPAIVDDVNYEEADVAEVRARSFPAAADFFDHAFGGQFGESNEEDWEDEEDAYDDDDPLEQPECRAQ